MRFLNVSNNFHLGRLPSPGLKGHGLVKEYGPASFFDPQILDIFLDNLEEVRENKNRYKDREEDFDKCRNFSGLAPEEDIIQR